MHDHPAAASFAIAAAATLVAALVQGAKPFYYDARLYWSLAESFARPDGFSLLNFDSPLRGYALPLLYLSLREVADGVGLEHATIVKLFNALVFAAIATVLAPAIAQVAWPRHRWGASRRLGLAGLLLVFWHGYLNFPLSDFPALAAALCALIAVSRPCHPGWMLGAGAATAVAVNMRPAYLVLVPIIVLLVAFGWLRDPEQRDASAARRVGCAVLLIGGFALTSLPQSLATHRHHGLWSFVPGTTARLTRLQLTEGTRLQRYDTYVGAGQPSPQMRFIDPVGSRLLDEHEGGVIVDGRQYLGLLARHPATMSGVFLRHLVNGLDQRYATPYIERLDTGGNRWMRVSGFVLVFLALARIAWPSARRSLEPARWRFPAALALCSVPAITSAVETRFMLPAVLLVYLLVLAPAWPNPLASAESGRSRWRAPAVLLVSLAAFLAVVLSMVGDATDHLTFG